MVSLLSTFQDKVHLDIYRELMGDVTTLELDHQLSLLLASDVSVSYGAFENQLMT